MAKFLSLWDLLMFVLFTASVIGSVLFINRYFWGQSDNPNGAKDNAEKRDMRNIERYCIEKRKQHNNNRGYTVV